MNPKNRRHAPQKLNKKLLRCIFYETIIKFIKTDRDQIVIIIRDFKENKLSLGRQFNNGELVWVD